MSQKISAKEFVEKKYQNNKKDDKNEKNWFFMKLIKKY